MDSVGNCIGCGDCGSIGCGYFQQVSVQLDVADYTPVGGDEFDHIGDAIAAAVALAAGVDFDAPPAAWDPSDISSLACDFVPRVQTIGYTAFTGWISGGGVTQGINTIGGACSSGCVAGLVATVDVVLLGCEAALPEKNASGCCPPVGGTHYQNHFQVMVSRVRAIGFTLLCISTRTQHNGAFADSSTGSDPCGPYTADPPTGGAPGPYTVDGCGSLVASVAGTIIEPPSAPDYSGICPGSGYSGDVNATKIIWTSGTFPTGCCDCACP